MTADSAAERLSRIAPNSMTEHRKPARYSNPTGWKYARQRNKNNKHCILRRTASENTKCLLGTPQAPK